MCPFCRTETSEASLRGPMENPEIRNPETEPEPETDPKTETEPEPERQRG